MGGKKRHNYKNLKIWLLGIEIAKDISDVLINFPKHEQYDLSSQMNRSSISIPSNIAKAHQELKSLLNISLIYH
jgi:four helix bundle protein